MTHATRLKPPDQWTDPRHRRGLQGELAARRLLEAKGWTIEAHRFRVGRHDLDLVARQGTLVAFIEVKTRSSQRFGAPPESIGWRKRQVLERLALIWRVRFGRADDRYRFDVAAVGWDRRTFPQIDHIEDAWRAVER